MVNFDVTINYVAWIVAVVVYYAGGALWYSPVLFGNSWMQLVGLTPEKMEAEKGNAWKSYLTSFISALLIGYGMARVMAYLGVATLTGGIISGLFLWVSFVLTTMATNSSFAGRPLKLLVIDAGYHLYGFLVMGAILGAW